jgi:transposase-like protein
VVTDRAPALRAAIDEQMPPVFHNTEQFANDGIECDRGWLKARLRPLGGLKRDHAARSRCVATCLRRTFGATTTNAALMRAHIGRIEIAFSELGGKI